jgi:glycosyltransferase involved in cell wall biosynthesis
MIRIGFDASALGARTTGAGEYQRNLVDALGAAADDLHFTVYLPRGISLPERPRLHAQEMPWNPGDRFGRIVKGSLLWRQTWRRDRLDLLHVPIYYLPPGAPKANVVTVYDVRFARFPETYPTARLAFLRRAVPWSLRRARHVIAISEYTRQEIVTLLGIPESKISVTHLAARAAFRVIEDGTTLADVRSRYRLPDRFILCTGTLEPRKNLVRVLEAFARLRREGSPHELVLAGFAYFGAGPILETIERLGISAAVHRVGYVPDSDLPAIYNLADLFVYPSLYEGFGIPLLEAMACGTPVVAAGASSIPEVVEGAGVLVDPLDVDSITEGMGHVLADRELARRLRDKGFARASHFTWAKTARDTARVYRRVLSGEV